MNWKKVVATLAVGVGLAWVGIPAAAQNVFKGRLSKVPVDAKMVPIILGEGNATATLNGTRVTIDGKFEGLGTNATIAKLHSAKMRGMHGDVIGDLTVSKAAAGTVSGVVNLTPEQITALKAGRLYVQIHSEKGPEGHLWGFLLP
jgi:hypothetical protein